MPKLKSLVLPLLILCSCSNEPAPIFHNYDDIKDNLISWSDVFNQEGDYYVYFYSERCGHCNDIKQEIINLYLEELVNLYFVCTDIEAMLGPIKDLHGVNSVDDFYIFGTPFLVEINNCYVVDYYIGSEEIRGFISILDKF